MAVDRARPLMPGLAFPFGYNGTMPRTRSPLTSWMREPINGLTHLTAAAVSLAGLIALALIVEGDLLVRGSVWLYGLALVIMFAASGAYHSVRTSERGVARLRRLDHSAIFLLIAATYTPVAVRFSEGKRALLLLGIVWGIAIAGIIVKLSGTQLPRWFSTGIYLALGGFAVLAARTVLLALPMAGLVWLTAGGLIFIVGAAVYLARWPDLWPGRFGFHELWHILVILGAASHYVLIAGFVAR